MGNLLAMFQVLVKMMMKNALVPNVNQIKRIKTSLPFMLNMDSTA